MPPRSRSCARASRPSLNQAAAARVICSTTIAALAAAPALRRFACAVLSESCFAVRALFFDKTPDANWKVVWHQDLTVAALQRVDVPGYGPWTDKAGVPHVQPPVDVLEEARANLREAPRAHADGAGKRVAGEEADTGWQGVAERGGIDGCEVHRARVNFKELCVRPRRWNQERGAGRADCQQNGPEEYILIGVPFGNASIITRRAPAREAATLMLASAVK